MTVINPALRTPPAPAGLQKRGPGRALWRSIVLHFELRPDELTILAAAARQADEIARLESELRDAPTLVSGSRDQEKPNPLFTEVRNHRLALARMLQLLALEDDPAAGGISKSSAGRKLARTRWAGPASVKRSA